MREHPKPAQYLRKGSQIYVKGQIFANLQVHRQGRHIRVDQMQMWQQSIFNCGLLQQGDMRK